MSRLGLVFAVLLGLGFPAGLALGTYLASAGSLAEPVGEVALPRGAIAEPSPRAPATTGREERSGTTGSVDISGPCDEAEHANDPRCTGGGDDDRSGRGRSGSDDDGDDDRSGRGRGGDDDDDDDDSSGSSGSGKGESGGDD